MDEIAVETLERATLAAVPPREVVAIDGWLIALDAGTVGRAHSAVPTRHEGVDPAVVDAIEQHYVRRGLAPVFRVPRTPAFDDLREALTRKGHAARQPTLTMVADAASVARMPSPAPVELHETPGDDWAAVFLGEGFDPVDGASRLGLLRRSGHSLFAGVREQGRVLAVGCGCFAEGWCGMHGMRTVPHQRGRGFAASILGTIAREAIRRGVSRAFLQVEQGNAAAQELYRRAGFEQAWCYEYWRR